MENHSSIFFNNAQQFFVCRRELKKEWNKMTVGLVCSNEQIPKVVDRIEIKEGKYNGDMRQHSHLTRNVVVSVNELYETAEFAFAKFELEMNKVITATNLPVSYLHLAKLKGRERAIQKANDDYSSRIDGPSCSWLYDILRLISFCC